LGFLLPLVITEQRLPILIPVLPYSEKIEKVTVDPMYGTFYADIYSLKISYDVAAAELTKWLGPTLYSAVKTVPNNTPEYSVTFEIWWSDYNPPSVHLTFYENNKTSGTGWYSFGGKIIAENGAIYNCSYSHIEIVNKDITQYLLTISLNDALAELIKQFGETYQLNRTYIQGNFYAYGQFYRNIIDHWDGVGRVVLSVNHSQKRVSVGTGNSFNPTYYVWENVDLK